MADTRGLHGWMGHDRVWDSSRLQEEESSMPLPRELWDDVVPESTTVVGDIDTFLVYVEHGDAWRDWCGRVRR